jgi:dTDP-L-rhamnose 4-epimerase
MVTGGAGFIGSAISSSLADEFEKVVVIDSLHRQVHPKGVRPASLDARAELIVGDIAEAGTWTSILSSFRPELIVHLAAETGTGQSLLEASRHGFVNVVGTTTMLDALANINHFPNKIILASSRAVYGEGCWRRKSGKTYYPGQRTKSRLEKAQWDFEDGYCLPCEATLTMPVPTSIYGSTKLAQEHILRSWVSAFDVDLTILRLQNVYGPGQSLANSYTGITQIFAQLARTGHPIPVYEDGAIVRDFIYIDDVAAAIAAAIKRNSKDLTPLDIGSGKSTTILELALRISQKYGAPDPVITGQYRLGDVRHASCRIERSMKELQWTPQTQLEIGLSSLLNWLDQQLALETRANHK